MLNENIPLPPDLAIAGALRAAVSEVMHDPSFIHTLAEELADVLDGIEDRAILKCLQNANDGQTVSEEEILAALKGK